MNQDTFSSNSSLHGIGKSGPHIPKVTDALEAETPTLEQSLDSVDSAQVEGAPVKKPKFEQRPVNQKHDKELVQETRNQIRGLIQEIAELAKSDCTTEEFYEGFLMRTTSALASAGGAIWVRNPDQQHVKLHYQINLKQTILATDSEAQKQHSILLSRLLESGQPTLVPPSSGSEEQGSNPTKFLLVVAPLVIDKQPIGLVEILQRPGSGPATQRGYLRFLSQMCAIASDFLKDHRLRLFSDQKSMWQRVEQFIKTVHSGLDPSTTAYKIANEGRRLIDCDRVSVALASGTKMQVQAVSGLDTIERRADQVKLLGKLATTVCKADEELWYQGDSSNLPPQIEKRLHEYIDKSHTKMLSIIPLVETQGEEENGRVQTRNVGALIVEQLGDSQLASSTKNRIEVVKQHGQSALCNSLEHNSIFLMPLWKVLGKLLAPLRRSNWPKTAITIGVMTLIGAVLWLCPYSFTLNCNGQLIPTNKVEIFAGLDGTLDQITVPEDPYATIEAGDVLALMINNDLMVEIEQLQGELNQAEANLRKLMRVGVERMSNMDEITILHDQQKTRKQIEGLKKALNFKKLLLEKLTVRSPIRGQVVNWQPRRTLLGRPVSRGQNLMTVVAPDTTWEIELEMPERRVGHLLEAQKSDQPLSVAFSLVSNPGREFEGKVVQIDPILEVKSEDGNTATVRIEFDNSQVPEELLRSGTRVRAKVLCGNRSLGYVWFHELIETTQTHLAYWF